MQKNLQLITPGEALRAFIPTVMVMIGYAVIALAIIAFSPEVVQQKYNMDFLLNSAFLGAGLGFDVFAATLAFLPAILLKVLAGKKEEALRAGAKWAQGNTLTHTILPFVLIVLGIIIYRYGGMWVAALLIAVAFALWFVDDTREYSYWLTAIIPLAWLIDWPRAVALVGFLMMARLLVPLVLDRMGVRPAWMEKLGWFEDDEPVMGSVKAYILVALDCIWGPFSKSTNAEYNGWSFWEVGASSPIKGDTVGLMAILGLLIVLGAINAIHIIFSRDKEEQKLEAAKRQPILEEAKAIQVAKQVAPRPAKLMVLALAFEWAALSFFGWMALLKYFFLVDISVWQLIGIDLIVTLLIFVPFWGRMVRGAIGETVEQLTKTLMDKGQDESADDEMSIAPA